MNILTEVRDHLLGEGFPVEVARKPDDATDALPYATVWLTSTIVGGSIEDLDSQRDPLVHIKIHGSTWEQVAGLHERLSDRMGSFPDAMSVKLDLEVGPFRDDATFPAPHSLWSDVFFRLTTSR